MRTRNYQHNCDNTGYVALGNHGHRNDLVCQTDSESHSDLCFLKECIVSPQRWVTPTFSHSYLIWYWGNCIFSLKLLVSSDQGLPDSLWLFIRLTTTGIISHNFGSSQPGDVASAMPSIRLTPGPRQAECWIRPGCWREPCSCQTKIVTAIQAHSTATRTPKQYLKKLPSGHPIPMSSFDMFTWVIHHLNPHRTFTRDLIRTLSASCLESSGLNFYARRLESFLLKKFSCTVTRVLLQLELLLQDDSNPLPP